MTTTPEDLALPEEALSVQAFYQQYGGSVGMNEAQFVSLWEESHAGYTGLPYHNWRHARQTLWGAMAEADFCQDNNLALNRRALAAAALYHDYAYHEDLMTSGFATKEERASTILAQRSATYGLMGSDTVIAIQAILATTRGIKPQSPEDKALVKADLANVAGPYKDFLASTKELRDEVRQITGKDIGFGEFAKLSLNILSDYYAHNLSYGDFDRGVNRKCMFENRSVQNLRKLVYETAETLGLKPMQLVGEIGGAALQKVLRVTYIKPDI